MKNYRQFKDWMREKEEKEKLCLETQKKHIEVQTLMSDINDSRKQNKIQIAKIKKDLEKLHSLPDKNQAEINQCEKKIDDLTQEKKKLEDDLQSIYKVVEKEMLPLIEKREKLESTLLEAMDCVNQAKTEVSVPETELKMLKSDEITQIRKYESIKSAYDDTKRELSEFIEKRNNFQICLPKTKTEIQQKTIKIQELQREEKVMQAQLVTLKNEVT